MTQLLACARQRNENINATRARCDVVRGRDTRVGHFVVISEGCALQVLRACSVNGNQLIQLLQPFNGRLFNQRAIVQSADITDETLLSYIRTCTVQQLGQILHGQRQGRPGAYFTQDEQETYHTNTQPTPTNGARG